VPDRRPRAIQHETLWLIELRWTALASLIKLVEITGALIDGLGKRNKRGRRKLRAVYRQDRRRA